MSRREWVDGLELLLDALGVPARDLAPPARVWREIERRIAATPQQRRRTADYRSAGAAGSSSPDA